ncbi:hypothetical protein CR152_28190 [Massilia violaceinigra]|uniref:Uncharacterized protein n=1 Tax=Massilia violaceinigra TaxID=2045208 RepID=A0A2D2DSJ4_9BURK|nr:hypothetical protein CR152_28190 [Massilia violaceinigra]
MNVAFSNATGASTTVASAPTPIVTVFPEIAVICLIPETPAMVMYCPTARSAELLTTSWSLALAMLPFVAPPLSVP